MGTVFTVSGKKHCKLPQDAPRAEHLHLHVPLLQGLLCKKLLKNKNKFKETNQTQKTSIGRVSTTWILQHPAIFSWEAPSASQLRTPTFWFTWSRNLETLILEKASSLTAQKFSSTSLKQVVFWKCWSAHFIEQTQIQWEQDLLAGVTDLVHSPGQRSGGKLNSLS